MCVWPGQILFPPLTGIEVHGEPRIEGSSIIIQVRLNINTQTRTIEHAIGAMKSSHLDL